MNVWRMVISAVIRGTVPSVNCQLSGIVFGAAKNLLIMNRVGHLKVVGRPFFDYC